VVCICDPVERDHCMHELCLAFDGARGRDGQLITAQRSRPRLLITKSSKYIHRLTSVQGRCCLLVYLIKYPVLIAVSLLRSLPKQSWDLSKRKEPSIQRSAFISTIHTTNTPSQTPQCAPLLNHLHTLTTIIPRLPCLKPAKLHLSVNENHPLSSVFRQTQIHQVQTTEYPLLPLRPAPGRFPPRQTITSPLYLLPLSWYRLYLLR
jgi:hypothetical protein